MKKLIIIFMMVSMSVLFIAAPVIAQDAIADDPAVVAVEKGKLVSQIWEVMNSPIGLTVVGLILTFLLGKVFTKKPEWKKLVIEHGPFFMQVIKEAEKKIPDGTENAGLARLDAALALIIKLEPKLKNASESDLKKCLTSVHTTAETYGNLKKE